MVEAAEDLGRGLSNLLLRGGKDKKSKNEFLSIRIPELATEASRLLCASLPSNVQSQVWDNFSHPPVRSFSEHSSSITRFYSGSFSATAYFAFG